jgi:hypothetical protein
MAGLVLVCGLLAVPAGHQVVDHRVLRRLLRAVSPSHGPEVCLTAHELAHASRPARLRLLADLGWLAYLASVLILALVLR